MFEMASYNPNYLILLVKLMALKSLNVFPIPSFCLLYFLVTKMNYHQVLKKQTEERPLLKET